MQDYVSILSSIIQALEDLPKTNNNVEGWHRSFSQLLGAYHPNILKFINGLKKEQSIQILHFKFKFKFYHNLFI